MTLLALAFVTFIQNNPGFVAWLIGGLFVTIAALIGSYWGMISYRLTKLETTDSHLEERVAEVESTLQGYSEHIGAGDRMFKQLMDRVERHMTEEEDRVWTGITKLTDKLIVIHEDNLKQHASITERLTRVEAKMPNGELARLIKLLEAKIHAAKADLQ